MTMDDRIRNDVLSKGAGCCALMFTVASTFSEQLVAVFGSYRTLMCLYAVLAIVSFWGLFRTSEERYVKASVGEASAVLSFYENLIDEMGGSPYPLRWEKGVYPAGDNIADAIRAETLYVAEDGGGASVRRFCNSPPGVAARTAAACSGWTRCRGTCPAKGSISSLISCIYVAI